MASFEVRVIRRVLRNLSSLAAQVRLANKGEYRHFKRILIPTYRGTSEIDHLVVSRYGLFVIELKDRSGWIFGDENAPSWTSVHFGRKYSFQNPLRQNYGHMKALEEYLEVAMETIHPLVVFRGQFAFKTPLPPGVRRHEFWSFIEERKEVLFDDAEVARVVRLLEDAKQRSGFMARRRHTRAVHDRYANDDVCPKCGGTLLVRTARNGPYAGQDFLGCSKYPGCKYVRRA